MAKLILTIHPEDDVDSLRESLEAAFNVREGVRPHITVNGMFVYYITEDYELVDDDEIRTRV